MLLSLHVCVHCIQYWTAINALYTTWVGPRCVGLPCRGYRAARFRGQYSML